MHRIPKSCGSTAHSGLTLRCLYTYRQRGRCLVRSRAWIIWCASLVPVPFYYNGFFLKKCCVLSSRFPRSHGLFRPSKTSQCSDPKQRSQSPIPLIMHYGHMLKAEQLDGFRERELDVLPMHSSPILSASSFASNITEPLRGNPASLL